MTLPNARNVDARYSNFNAVAGDQYIINQCFSQTPVSHLFDIFLSFKNIARSVDQVKSNKRQLSTLEFVVATLLLTLDAEYRGRRLSKSRTAGPLADLHRLLNEIATFLKEQISADFLQSIYDKEEHILTIEGYHRQISSIVDAFQISALLNIEAWHSANEQARIADQQVLNERLDTLEANQYQLMDALDVKEINIRATMASLHRRVTQRLGGERERAFFTNSLQFLTTISGQQVDLQCWTVTSYEVKFVRLIGRGGFGKVYEGRWNKANVAIKVMTSSDGVTPNSESIRREIGIWLSLQHPNVLPFLGANVLDDSPFTVMPYLKNGNARQYLTACPECDVLRLLHDISLGIAYLHSRKVVHGDLKAMNVLIDDNEKAVLCDFGLSRIKADVRSNTSMFGTGTIVGSRNWMSPERLMGGSVRKPSYIYAFGMIIYEIYTNETPLGHIESWDFLELVVEKNVRPERPDEDEAPKLFDEIWELAQGCWAKEPLQRPIAESVCKTISHLMGTHSAVSVNKPSTADEDLGSVPTLHRPQRSLSPLSIPGTPTFQPDTSSLVNGYPPAPITINLPHQEGQEGQDVGGSPLLVQPTSFRRPLAVPSRSYSPSSSSQSDQLPTVVGVPAVSHGVPSTTGGATTVQLSRGRRSSRDAQDHLMMLRRKRSYPPSYKQTPSYGRPPMILSNDYHSSYGASRPQAPITINLPPQGVQAARQPYPVQQPGPIQVPIGPIQLERSRSRSYSPSYRSYESRPPVIVGSPQEYSPYQSDGTLDYDQPPTVIMPSRNDDNNWGRLQNEVLISPTHRNESRSYSPSYRTRENYGLPVIMPPSQGYRSQGYRSKRDTQSPVVVVPGGSAYRSDQSYHEGPPVVMLPPSRNDEYNLGRLRKVWRALTK